jgi:hypothetical protein
MMASEIEIKQQVKTHIDSQGGAYSSWYVGIASDRRDRLFNGHGVLEKGDGWIFRTSMSAEEAQRVERYFIDEIGTDGGPGGGDTNTTAVYAYKKNGHTNP